MNEEQKLAYYEKYQKSTHALGRILTASVLIMLLGAPFLIGSYLGALPDMGAVLTAFLSIGIVHLISCIAEYILYVPMLGAGGSYLAFITGNLINMKIPCAINARDIVGVKSGTTENEIISTLSIATSSLVTLVILALGTLVSFLVSLAAVKFLVGFVRKHSFEGFGWYRIALALIVVIYFAFIR